VPELPDVTVYIECLSTRCAGQVLDGIRISGPAVLRSFDPPVSEVAGKRIIGFRRIGKRIVFELEEELFCVIHLMVAGRFRWRAPRTKLSRKLGLAAFDFADGTLLLTEASPKKRASLHIVRGPEALAEHDPGGLEIFEIDEASFAQRLTLENHTLKRALTDPHLFSGIGNAYSDEILHAAQLSPIKLTSKLTDEEIARLFAATRQTLQIWTDRLREQTGDKFPEKVTAFRPEMAVHGKYREPCPVCDNPVQRIVYAANETNYCATCQTGGRLLADRAMSQLLKKDWPRSLEEMEARLERGRVGPSS
jgi:formamidopyrimidine-DNA glycosylase